MVTHTCLLVRAKLATESILSLLEAFVALVVFDKVQSPELVLWTGQPCVREGGDCIKANCEKQGDKLE